MVSSEEIKRRLDAKRRGIDPESVTSPPPTGSMKKCPSCDTANPTSAKFCVGCGKDISQINKDTRKCTHCGKENPSHSKFCINCGAKLTPTAPAQKPETAPSHEQKICPSCNQVNRANAKFCVVCGHKFDEDKQTVANEPEAPVSVEESSEITGEPIELEEEVSKEPEVHSDEETVDPVEKIKKAKELLDMGAITQEEFDKIKEKYLEQL